MPPVAPTNAADFSQPAAWIAELDRSRRLAETYWPDWEENLGYYTGKSPEATTANEAQQPYVNINADFYNVEIKVAQLFFETPTLTLTSKGEFKPHKPAMALPGAPPQPAPNAAPIVAAHRELLNELLGPSHADVLRTIHKAIKDCLLTSGEGATKIGYTPTLQTVPTEGLAVAQPEAQLPVDEQWFWERIPSKKFRKPADFHDTDFDKAPWLAMDFRMPLSLAKRLFNIPEEYAGTQDRDEKVLNDTATKNQDTSAIPYVNGTEIWYYAHIFDADVINPQVIRRHVVLEGVEGFVEKSAESPFQTLLPNGRLSADSMRGYPIHPLTLRDVPDSAFIPSDSSMARGLIRELCKFRTQQVMERDANLPRFLYDSSKLTPATVDKIVQGTVGSMIPVEEDALGAGPERIMAQVTQGSQTRGSYAANDYIQRDLEKTLGIDPAAAGVKGQGDPSATEVAVVDRQRNVRLDSERRRVLAWYLKGVEKFSALVARFMTPQLAVPYIGTQAAQAWASWDKQTWDGRFVFGAKPDSQIKLDAAAERKFALDIYQFTAKDPNVNRVALLKSLFEKANIDPSEVIVEALPEQHKEPSIGFTFKGEDFLGPQAPQVREILAQLGYEISQPAISESGSQLLQQMVIGIRDADGKATPAVKGPAQHGGVTEKVRPLDQQSADQSGQRAGRKPLA